MSTTTDSVSTLGNDDKKKRSSKACDNCRRAKSRCVREGIGEDGQGEEAPCVNCRAAGHECTFLGASKKRGPPKGYIEAIENRMHRMEALLGGLLHNDDPRAQALLEELVGDIEARELLSRDLRTAVATGRNNPPALKSWQRMAKKEDGTEYILDTQSTSSSADAQTAAAVAAAAIAGASGTRAPITQRGFDLANNATSTASTAYRDPGKALSPFSSALAQLSSNDNANLQEPSWFTVDDLFDPNSVNGMDRSTISASADTFGSNAPQGLPIPTSGGMSTNFTPSSQIQPKSFSTSPRHQRRRLDAPSSKMATSPSASSSSRNPATSVFANQVRSQAGARDAQGVSAPSTIPHTGSAYYTVSQPLSAGGGLPVAANAHISTSPSSSHRSPDFMANANAGDGLSPMGHTAASNDQSGNPAQPDGPLSELADVVGQLSLDENKEVRYHGRSSGLYLISKSARYKDFFWRFPKAGVWPPAEPGSDDDGGATQQEQLSLMTEPSPGSAPDNAASPSRDRESAAQGEGVAPYPYGKTEDEIMARTKALQALPDKRTSDHLLELYWIYVHPHVPLLYRSLFVRQYRNTIHGSSGVGPDGRSLPAQAVGGRVPAVLLFAIYSVAARHSDTGGIRKHGVYWKAGDGYANKAKELIHEDFGSSRLSTVQALLLLAYREIGCGANAQSWTYLGMAIRMAQDLGLFRDVDKWFLPVNAFGYEEKQTRKRVWWACIVLDKYVSAYIGRPMMIFERDYDVALPAEDEPDEHDIWRPIRPDGTDWSEQPIMNTMAEPLLAQIRSYPQGVKSNSISCFNHSATLSVLFSRIIANLYAIRVRVLGQNSESLLAHLDQALANWYISLPTHLQYNSASKRAPPPHVLALHCQFFAALILLHRPFIPAQGASKTATAFPSHSICTTAAAAISNIVTLYSKTYTLRQCVPFLTYYLFSAGIMHVYNSTYDEGLAPTAKFHLLRCMRALKEMDSTWASALRQNELLQGIVDLRDADVEPIERAASAMDEDDTRGRKRQAETQDVDVSGRNTPSKAPGGLSEPFRRLPTFHTRPAFASASLNQIPSSDGQPVKRSTSANVSSRRRHNSVTAATLRGSGNSNPDDRFVKTPASATSNNAPLPSAPLPSSDFTFMSPAVPMSILPSVSEDVPVSASVPTMFDFGHTSTPGQTSPGFASIGIGSPIAIAPPNPEQQQHSFNILGLTSDFDFSQNILAQTNNNTTSVGVSMPASAYSSDTNMGLFPPAWNNPAPIASSMETHTNVSDFMFDPFWQSFTQSQMPVPTASHENAASGNDVLGIGVNPFGTGRTPENQNSTTSPFGDMSHAAFFGVPFSADPSADEWADYLSAAMPRDVHQS